MPLFESLALACAPGVALDVLIGIASVESGVQPLSIRDGAKLISVASVGDGVSFVLGSGERGREFGLGLLGLTAVRLQSVGAPIADAFEPCAAMRAAAKLMAKGRAVPERAKYDPQVLDKVVIRDWWRPDNRFVSGTAYEMAVNAERGRGTVGKQEIGGELPRVDVIDTTAVVTTISSSGRTRDREAQSRTTPRPAAPEENTAPAVKDVPRWDVFGRARNSSVLVFGRK